MTDLQTALAKLGRPPRVACVASSTDRAQAALVELESIYGHVDVAECEVIVAIGGDGFLLRAMHEHLHLQRPMFGMNQGTVGFLMNDYRSDGLLERVAAASRRDIHPLAMTATLADGTEVSFRAFNEVAVTRHSGQSANIRVVVDGVERIAMFVGDGMIVATAAGSTAYNLSAHGPIIPLGSDLLALTPVSPFRPRRWKGALVSRDSEIVLENLDPEKRPLDATADYHEAFFVTSVRVHEDLGVSVSLLFDPDRSLEDRILAEQFAI